jgi:hypothetical protein
MRASMSLKSSRAPPFVIVFAPASSYYSNVKTV